MAYLPPTEHLGVALPEPGTQQPFDVAQYNAQWQTADARIGDLKLRTTNLETATDRPQYVGKVDGFYSQNGLRFLGQIDTPVGSYSLPFVEVLDPLNWHDPVNTTERITPTKRGFYEATLTLRFSSSSSIAGIRQGSILRNGVELETDVRTAVQVGASTTISLRSIEQMNGTSDWFSFTLISGSAQTHDIHATVRVQLIQPN